MIVQKLGIEAVHRRRGRGGLGMCDEMPAFASCFSRVGIKKDADPDGLIFSGRVKGCDVLRLTGSL